MTLKTRKARLTLCVAVACVLGAVFSSGAQGAIAFSNGNDITIPSGSPADTGPGNASPYPSSINVSGLLGTVGTATVTLTNLTHTYPGDIDILLTGPAGQAMILMSDAGSNHSVTNVDLTFADAAGSSLTADQITSGNYRPTNLADGVGDDTFTGPAPAPPYGSTLATFTGINPNGTWNLWVRDDFLFDVGAISGWTLTLDGPVLAPGTPPPPPPPPANPAPVPHASGACANTQRGTAGSDTLLGTAFGDLLKGLGGADTLRGRRGRDCLNGGTGGDDLFGGRGNDRLVGGPGNDTLACGPGRDVAVVSGPDDFFGCERVRRR